MKKKSKPENFVRQPNYPGGNNELNNFIRANLQYPEEAIKSNIEGAVAVDYNVDVFGKVIEAKIKHGIGYGCDEEALRLVKLLHFEKKKYHGLHVVFHKSIVINFHLNTASVLPQKSELKINYEVTQKSDDSTIKISYSIIPEKGK